MPTFHAPHKLPTPTQTPELLEAMYWGHRGLNTGWGGGPTDLRPCLLIPPQPGGLQQVT